MQIFRLLDYICMTVLEMLYSKLYRNHFPCHLEDYLCICVVHRSETAFKDLYKEKFTPLTLIIKFSIITVLLRKHETIIQQPENTETL